MLWVLDATFPFMRSFFGGGEGRESGEAGVGAGGLGAKCGLPWLTRTRSGKSDVDSEAPADGVDGTLAFSDVILPPG